MTEEQKQEILQGIAQSLATDATLLDRARQSSDLHNQYKTILQGLKPDQSFAEFERLIILNDFHAFTLYSLLDLYVIIQGMLNARTSYEQLFFIKHGYLVVFESLETYYLHAANLKKLVEENFPSMKESFGKVTTAIRKHTSQYGDRSKLAEIRNSIIAHIGTSFEKYYDSLAQLQGDTGVETILSFAKFLQSLQVFLQQFVSEANVQWKQSGIEQELSLKSQMASVQQMLKQDNLDSAEVAELKQKLLDLLSFIKSQ